MGGEYITLPIEVLLEVESAQAPCEDRLAECKRVARFRFLKGQEIEDVVGVSHRSSEFKHEFDHKLYLDRGLLASVDFCEGSFQDFV